MAKQKDSVNHPPHYTQGPIECIDAMQSAFGKENLMMFCIIAAFKYLWRANEKGSSLENVKKAIWYLTKYVALAESKKPAKKTTKKKDSFIAKAIKRIDAIKKRFKRTAKKPAKKPVQDTHTIDKRRKRK